MADNKKELLKGDTSDNPYKEYLILLYDSCAEFNKCDEEGQKQCPHRERCVDVWDIIYNWTSHMWEQRKRILKMQSEGMRVKEIARAEGTSERTIKNLLMKYEAY